MIPATVSASLAFVLPVATPPNAIAFSYGVIKVYEMVCMYVCIYVCMHTCMYVCMYVCMYLCMYVFMYVCMYVCM